MMNEKSFDLHWSEIMNLIQEKWSRLRRHDIEYLKGDLDGLVERIRNAYGCAQARAEREYHEFRQSLSELQRPPVGLPVPIRVQVRL